MGWIYIRGNNNNNEKKKQLGEIHGQPDKSRFESNMGIYFFSCDKKENDYIEQNFSLSSFLP